MGVEKTRKTIFPETHEQCEKNMLGKKSSEKSAKKVFIFTQISLPKNGGENARNNFSQTQE